LDVEKTSLSVKRRIEGGKTGDVVHSEVEND
jgi:hypothetical protein